MWIRALFSVAVLGLASSAMAQTSVSSTGVAVSVSLTPVCNIKTQAGALAFGTYTPFTQAAITKTTNLVFQCSQGLAPTQVALGTTAAASEATISAAGASANAVGLLSGLRYTLATNTISEALTAGTGGTAATAGANGTGGSNSSAKEYSFLLTASMAGGQAGGNEGSSSHNYTVTVTY